MQHHLSLMQQQVPRRSQLQQHHQAATATVAGSARASLHRLQPEPARHPAAAVVAARPRMAARPGPKITFSRAWPRKVFTDPADSQLVGSQAAVGASQPAAAAAAAPQDVLPPAPVVATMLDLELLRRDLRIEVGQKIDDAVNALKTEIKIDLANLRSEIKTDLANLRSEIKTDMAAIKAVVDKTNRIVIVLVVLVGVIGGAVAFQLLMLPP